MFVLVFYYLRKIIIEFEQITFDLLIFSQHFKMNDYTTFLGSKLVVILLRRIGKNWIFHTSAFQTILQKV